MSKLAKKQCIPCKGGVPPLEGSERDRLMGELGGDWKLDDRGHLEKQYRFSNFAHALAFTNSVGELAEQQGHHPDIHLSWGKVGVEIWTHKINGLTESDFVLAAKIDALMANT